MKINRKKLLKTLELLKPGLASTEAAEQTTSFIFVDDAVYSCNQQIVIAHPIERCFDGAVLAKELFALLSKFPDEEVDIEADESELRIKGKNRKAGIALAAKIALNVDDLKKRKRWKKLPSDFVDGLKFCLMSVGRNTVDPVLTGVHIVDNRIESANNYQLGRWVLEKEVSDDMLIPGSTAEVLISYEPIEYSVTDNWIHFRNKDNVTLSTLSLEGKYPTIDAMLDIKGESFELPKELRSILERAEVVMDRVGGTVTIKLSNASLEVSSQNAQGWFSENVRVRYKGDAIEFQTRPEFLKDISDKLLTVQICKDSLKFEGKQFVHRCATVSE